MKKKKINRGYILFFVLALLVLLIAIYAIINPMLKNNAENETVSDNTVTIVDFKTADMRSLSYIYESNEEINLKYDTKSASWYLEEEKDFPLKQDTISAMAKAIATITASRVIGAGEISDEECGFTAPLLKVGVTYASGQSYEYTLGQYNSFNSCYYFKISGDENVYLTPSALAGTFNYSMYTMVEYDTIPAMSAETISSYDIERSMLKTTVTDKEAISEIPYLYFSDCVDFKPGDDKKTEYGLGGSATRLIIHYSETKTATNEDGSLSSTANITVNYDVSFFIGNICETDETKRYVMFEDSSLVYLMNTDSLDLLMQAEGELTAVQ